MADPQAFNVLRRADNDELVVMADFAATGRSAASFHDLVARLTVGYHIWETAPAPYGSERGMTGLDQAQRWLSGIRDSGLRVRALLGFCGGGVYAGVLADEIGRWQETPRLLLFDPGFAERRMLVEHIENFYRRLASSFTPDQLAQAQDRLHAADRAAADPLELAGFLGDLAHAVLEPAIVRAGWSPEASAQTANLVTGYLHWLAGAVALDPRAAWSAATAVNSATPDVGLNAMPADERASVVAKAIYFPVPHADLLRTGDVAATVDELLS